MSARHWMPFYIGDYRADTSHLSTTQHGAYLLLLMAYWQQGGLPDDDEQLARIAGLAPAEWKRHRPIIGSFFEEGWRHGRVDRELATAGERYERRSKASQKGNATRWGGRNGIALGSQLQPQPQPHQKDLSQGGETLGEEGHEQEAGRPSRWPALAVVPARMVGEGTR